MNVAVNVAMNESPFLPALQFPAAREWFTVSAIINRRPLHYPWTLPVIAVSQDTEHQQPVERLGFITIVDVPELGYAGGLLVVSPTGRPIEFHCTPPVAENRTQKILYGQTYRGFLFCDQIGASLVKKCVSAPQILITDQAELLFLGSNVDTPIAQLCDEQSDGEQNINHRGGDVRIEVNSEVLVIASDDSNLVSSVKSACLLFNKSLPLIEPFERIQMAIKEAQSVAR